jgi:hypothetical protein
MIRQATSEDMPMLEEGAKKFFALHPFSMIGVDFDGDSIAEALTVMIEAGGVFVGERGAIGGVIAPVWFSPSTKIALELFWYGAGEGLALKRRFETWAHEKGAKAVVLTTLGREWDARTAEILDRSGYDKSEQTWLKVI